MDAASRVRKLLALAKSEEALGNEHAARAARRAAERVARRHAGGDRARGAGPRPSGAPRGRVTRGPYIERPDIAAPECCECRKDIDLGEGCQVRIGPHTAAFVHRRCVPAAEVFGAPIARGTGKSRLTTGPYRDFLWDPAGARCCECGYELHGPHLQTLGPGVYQYGFVHVACVPLEERP